LKHKFQQQTALENLASIICQSADARLVRCEQRSGAPVRKQLQQQSQIPKEADVVNETRQEVQAVRPVDFVARDHGSIWLFTPLTPAAFAFLSAHIQEDVQYFGDSLAVECRFVEDLVHGLTEHGLKVVRS
jgi:hypothetical protein